MDTSSRHSHNHEQFPETCPEIDQHLQQTDQELRSLAAKEATIVGRIALLQDDLSEVRAQIRASRYGAEVAKDAIRTYRLHLISLEDDDKEAPDEDSPKKKAFPNGKTPSKKGETIDSPAAS